MPDQPKPETRQEAIAKAFFDRGVQRRDQSKETARYLARVAEEAIVEWERRRQDADA